VGYFTLHPVDTLNGNTAAQLVCEFTVLTRSSCDGVAHVTLVCAVERRQKLVEVFVRLATEFRQQQLRLAIRRRLVRDALFLVCAEHLPVVMYGFEINADDITNRNFDSIRNFVISK